MGGFPHRFLAITLIISSPLPGEFLAVVRRCIFRQTGRASLVARSICSRGFVQEISSLTKVNRVQHRHLSPSRSDYSYPPLTFTPLIFRPIPIGRLHRNEPRSARWRHHRIDVVIYGGKCPARSRFCRRGDAKTHQGRCSASNGTFYRFIARRWSGVII